MPASHDTPTPAVYEPPQIEQILTEDVLTREVHYAGQPSGDFSDND